MAITVNIPTLLARHTGGQRHHVVAGATVREAIERVTRDYPEFGKRFVEATLPGNEFVTIYLNDQDARFKGGLDTPVLAGDEISIVSAIAGG